MKRRTGKSASSISVLLVVWLLMGVSGRTFAQNAGHVHLPPTAGATPMSAMVDAQARYLVAQGDCIESFAVARKINAETYTIELKNWVDEVDAYFKRRELNRLWRRKENPSYLDHLKRAQDTREKEMREQFDTFAKGDLTNKLNWLLAKLAGPAIQVQYLGPTQSASAPALARELSDAEKHQIWITDGGRKGSQLVCRLSDGDVLATPWPVGLRNDECKAGRADYEASLGKVKESGQDQRDEAHRQCVAALNGLFTALENAYPREDRKKDCSAFLEYNGARNFLRSLVARAARIAETTDSDVFGGELRFQGKTVEDLLRHMNDHGVHFFPCRPGGEGAYEHLLKDLSAVYMALGKYPTAPAGGNQ
jgi:hypothetical protein